MSTLSARASDFLTHRRVAVAGVSRTRQDAAANLIYRRFKARGYQVFPLNPHASVVEGDTCYPNLAAIPGGVSAVVIATRPQVAEEIVRTCPGAGVKHVWMHRSLVHDGSSVSDEAVRLCEAGGINVIPGACPLMFGQTADFGHKCMRWIMGLTGRLPA